MRLVLFLLSASLLAQTNALIQSGPAATVAPGQPVTITVRLDAAPPDQIAALQFAIAAPATFGNPTPASLTTSKPLLQCRPVTTGLTTAHTCLLAGQNNTAIPNSQLVTLTFNPTVPILVGTHLVTVSGVVASSGAANSLALLPGPSISVTVGLLGDINGDGRFDSADTLAFQLQILTTPCTPALDLTGDGKCDVIDVQRFINRGLGAP